MGEIDDDYKSEVEDIDSNFLEELKNGKDRKNSFKKYREKLKKSRNKFNKRYEKCNRKEISRARGAKKKIAKVGKFKHLEISHFDFSFSFLERVFMKMDVAWFNFVRRIKRFEVWVVPSAVVYGYYKIMKFVASGWRDGVEIWDLCIDGLKSFFVGAGIWFWEEIKIGGVFVLGLLRKCVFWKKKISSDKEGSSETGEGSSDKESEGKSS